MKQSTEAAPCRPLLTLIVASCAPAGSAAAQEPPTFGEAIEVAVREVDVVVLDRDGRPILDLAREDFELYENGRPVEIVNFAAYRDPSGHPVGAAVTKPAADLSERADAADDGSQMGALESSDAPPTTWVVYLDQPRLSRKGRLDLLTQLERFFAAGLRPGDRAMVLSFDGASLAQLAPLGSDGKAVAAALAGARKRLPGRSVDSRADRDRILRTIIDAAMYRDTAAREAQDLYLQIEAIAEQDLLQGAADLRALHDLLGLVAGIEGRVALVLASGGLASSPADELWRNFQQKFAQLVPGIAKEAEVGRRALGERNWRMLVGYTRLLDTLNSSRVTVYSVFGGGDRGPHIDSEVGGVPVLAPGQAVTPEASSSVARFAAATGGRAFVAAPDLATRLGEARTDLTHYYSLGYQPLGDAPRRRVEVRVRRDGARVRHRSHVAFRSGEVLAGDAAITELLGDGASPDPFGVVVEVGESVGSKKELRVPVEVRVPLRNVTVLPRGGGFRGNLLVHFALRRPSGAFLRLEPRPIAFEIPEGKLDAALAQHVSMRVEILVEPGPQRLAVSVLDEAAGVVGTVAADFEVAR